MSSETKINYHGWSSFSIETANGTLLFDPLYRKIFGAKWSGFDDFKGADVVCLTHGHYDHYVDAPVILKKTDSKAVGSADICEHLSSHYKIDKEKLIEIKPFQEVTVSDFKITAFEWGHREVSIPKFIKEGILRARIFPSFQFAWLNMFKSPFNAPYYGFFVELPDKLRIMNYCEGFSDHMKIEEVEELGEKFEIDILFAGTQLNFEEYLARGVSALSPKTVILFHPHKALFEKLGLKSSPPEKFMETVKQSSPDVKIIMAEPNFSYKTSLLL